VIAPQVGQTVGLRLLCEQPCMHADEVMGVWSPALSLPGYPYIHLYRLQVY
jgi:hypothetical protein